MPSVFLAASISLTVRGIPAVRFSQPVSVIRTVLGTAVNLLLQCMVAYPLSRKTLVGRRFFVLYVVFTLLFNGGIFTTDNQPGRITGNNNDELPTFEGQPATPDFRRWMGCCFMSQNQRWLGWPTVASGDSDLLSPTTRFYRDRAKVAGPIRREGQVHLSGRRRYPGANCAHA